MTRRTFLTAIAALLPARWMLAQKPARDTPGEWIRFRDDAGALPMGLSHGTIYRVSYEFEREYPTDR